MLGNLIENIVYFPINVHNHLTTVCVYILVAIQAITLVAMNLPVRNTVEEYSSSRKKTASLWYRLQVWIV